MGVKDIVINPNIEFAHVKPRVSRIVGVMSGNEAETKNRMNVNAANIDAL